VNRREFVQRAAIRLLDPAEPDANRAIRWAERLWDRLSARGYGAPEARGPREPVNWVDRLTTEQRAWFDEFWSAFALKKGKQRAAMRWAQICPDEATARHIIEAGAAEAKRPVPDGQVRKHAEGWLSERRWEDHTPSAGEHQRVCEVERANEISRLRGELAHVRQLSERTRDATVSGQLDEQIEDLQQRLTALEGA